MIRQYEPLKIISGSFIIIKPDNVKKNVLTSTNAGNAGSVQATNVSDGKLNPLEPIATT